MSEKKTTNKTFIFFLIILSAILGGGTGVFGKIALKEIPPFSFTFLRFFIASIFLIPVSLKSLPKFRKQDYKIILLSLLASANVILFSFGIRLTTANISQMIYTAVPVISALFSFYLLKERFGIKKISGIALGFIGTLLIISLPLISNKWTSQSSIWGNLIIVVAMLSISLYWVLSKKFQNKYTPLEINNYFIFTTTILLFFLCFFDLSNNLKWYSGVSLNSYLSLGYVAIFSTAIYYLISQIIVKKASPVMASMVLFVQPLATFTWAYFFLSEKLTILFSIGAILSLLGVGIYNFAGKKNYNIEA